MTATIDATSPEHVGVLSRRAFAVHLAAIGIVLLLSSILVGHTGFVFIDEAAVLAQAELVEEGSWTVEWPLSDVDPTGSHAPMDRSVIVGERFAPFPNHPLHVLLAAGAKAVGGPSGVRVLSVLGVVGAALTAGLLARPVSRTAAVLAMWIAGIASPLVFDANLVVAHSLGAAVAGGMLVIAFRAVPRASGRAPVVRLGVAVGVLACVGALLRSEMVLFALAVALVAGARAFRDRSVEQVAVGVGAAVGATLAYLLEPVWVEQLVGASNGLKYISPASRGGIEGAVRAAGTVLIDPGGANGPLLVLAVSAAAGAAWLVHRRPRDPGLAAVAAATGAVAAAVLLLDPGVVPGLVWAFPLLLAGLASGAGWRDGGAAIRRSLQVATVFALSVLASQYSVGGGVEWGWRYVAVAMPAVGAALGVSFADLLQVGTSRVARASLAGIALAGLLVPASGLLWQREQVERTGRLGAGTEAALRSSDASLIVAAESAFGRFAWRQSIAGEVLAVRRDPEQLGAVLHLLADRNVERLLLVWHGDEPRVPASGYAPAEGVIVILEDVYLARTFVLRGR